MSDKDLQGVADCVSDIGQHFSRRLHLSRRDHLKGPDRRSVQSLEPDPRCDDDVKDSLPEIVIA
jgi:hypothetical protein